MHGEFHASEFGGLRSFMNHFAVDLPSQLQVPKLIPPPSPLISFLSVTVYLLVFTAARLLLSWGLEKMREGEKERTGGKRGREAEKKRENKNEKWIEWKVCSVRLSPLLSLSFYLTSTQFPFLLLLTLSLFVFGIVEVLQSCYYLHYNMTAQFADVLLLSVVVHALYIGVVVSVEGAEMWMRGTWKVGSKWWKVEGMENGEEKMEMRMERKIDAKNEAEMVMKKEIEMVKTNVTATASTAAAAASTMTTGRGVKNHKRTTARSYV